MRAILSIAGEESIPSEARKCLFTQADHVDLVYSQLVRACAETDFAIVAYCFMPDHLHLLLHGLSPDADAMAFVHRSKQLACSKTAP